MLRDRNRINNNMVKSDPLRVNRQRHVTIKPGTFLAQMKLNNPTVDTII